ncbi:MAG TPA: tRNA (adenosine(37)-N6)-threonylcarbamoyltransferase complex transferase subunit TsaD [Gemmatimonadales bacterium]|nr:tRNA (adenosine(37)-N6)-threonylcarbamoyltransferase complex transferase subunit TsaD [Gemmatimonadales bacterium]
MVVARQHRTHRAPARQGPARTRRQRGGESGGAALRRILGLETSCDETSAAVLDLDGTAAPELKSLVILSQDIHAVFGGVVPELASRAHLEAVGPVVRRALEQARTALDDVDGIAVTAGPGLVGALLVGLMYGKTLAWSRKIPLIGVNHLEGHLFAPTLEDSELAPPFVALLVSGGHTLLLDVMEWGRYRLVGRTLDDAAGEAFDKVAKLLGLEYPGGPIIERLAAGGEPGRFQFPRPMLGELGEQGPNRYNFSFSGLKSAVRRAVQKSEDLERDRADLARGFQDAAIEVLVAKTAALVDQLGYRAAIIGGGVACNRALADALRTKLAGAARVSVASPRLNTDNAAMIAAAGAWRLARGERSDLSLEPRDDLPIPGLSDGASRS